MRAAEEAAFARGVAVEALMDRAGAGVARAVQRFFPQPGTCVVYAGKGHNGGDALVAADCLQRAGWKIEVRLAFPENECSELTRKKFTALNVTGGPTVSSRPLVILDGLLGLGAKPSLREPIRGAAREINQWRIQHNAYVFAVDIPTGLDGDTGEADKQNAIHADFTVAIGYAKRGLVEDLALDFVGRLEVVPLPDLQLADG